MLLFISPLGLVILLAPKVEKVYTTLSPFAFMLASNIIIAANIVFIKVVVFTNLIF